MSEAFPKVRIELEKGHGCAVKYCRNVACYKIDLGGSYHRLCCDCMSSIWGQIERVNDSVTCLPEKTA